MKLKKVLSLLVSLCIISLIGFLIITYKKEIYIIYRDYIVHERDNISIENNEYYKSDDFLFVQNTDNFIANNEQDINNILYSIINSGEDSVTFYCSDNYDDCLNTIERISSDDVLLSNINNFVDPFNSFKTLNMSYSTRGNIKITVTKNYTDNEIISLNEKIDNIISELNIDGLSDKEKINRIHNYIINNSNYIESDMDDSLYDNAYDLLFNGYGTCNSYADAMALFLDKLNIKNYKISSDEHIWNLVFIDDSVLHLDLTWDDPILSNGENDLLFTYFLINDERLKELDDGSHNYDQNTFLELKRP